MSEICVAGHNLDGILCMAIMQDANIKTEHYACILYILVAEQ